MRISDWSSDVCSSDLHRSDLDVTPTDGPTKQPSRDSKHVSAVGDLLPRNLVQRDDDIRTVNLSKRLMAEHRNEMKPKRSIDERAPALASAGFREAISVSRECQFDCLAPSLLVHVD